MNSRLSISSKKKFFLLYILHVVIVAFSLITFPWIIDYCPYPSQSCFVVNTCIALLSCCCWRGGGGEEGVVLGHKPSGLRLLTSDILSDSAQMLIRHLTKAVGFTGQFVITVLALIPPQ